MMFRVALLAVFLAIAAAFGPARLTARRTQLSMTATPNPKSAAAALLAAAMFVSPTWAVEGAAPKQSYFGRDATSSPFPSENREDPIYSPYSPYGDGTKAVYNARAGGKEEITFWKEKLAESEKRVARVPAYAAKKTWYEITTELTRYTYSMRESMLRLASGDKTAVQAAKTYFVDLNDMFEWAVKKDETKVKAAFEKSVSDMAAFKAAAPTFAASK